MVEPLAGYTVGVTASLGGGSQVQLLEGLGATCHLAPLTQLMAAPFGEIARSVERFAQDPPPNLFVDTKEGLDLWLDVADTIGHGPNVRALLKSSVEVVLHEDDLEEGSSCCRLRPLLSRPTAERCEAHQLARSVAGGEVDALTFTTRLAAEQFLLAADEIGVNDHVRLALRQQVLVATLGEDVAEAFAHWPEVGVVFPEQARVGLLVAKLTSTLAERSRQVRLGRVAVVLQGRLMVEEGREPVMLSWRESQLLDLLLDQPGAVVTKATLADRMWGSGDLDLHRVEVAVGRLRKRLEPTAVGIETVVRRGYRVRP